MKHYQNILKDRKVREHLNGFLGVNVAYDSFGKDFTADELKEILRTTYNTKLPKDTVDTAFEMELFENRLDLFFKIVTFLNSGPDVAEAGPKAISPYQEDTPESIHFAAFMTLLEKDIVDVDDPSLAIEVLTRSMSKEEQEIHALLPDAEKPFQKSLEEWNDIHAQRKTKYKEFRILYKFKFTRKLIYRAVDELLEVKKKDDPLSKKKPNKLQRFIINIVKRRRKLKSLIETYKEKHEKYLEQKKIVDGLKAKDVSVRSQFITFYQKNLDSDDFKTVLKNFVGIFPAEEKVKEEHVSTRTCAFIAFQRVITTEHALNNHSRASDDPFQKALINQSNKTASSSTTEKLYAEAELEKHSGHLIPLYQLKRQIQTVYTQTKRVEVLDAINKAMTARDAADDTTKSKGDLDELAKKAVQLEEIAKIKFVHYLGKTGVKDDEIEHEINKLGVLARTRILGSATEYYAEIEKIYTNPEDISQEYKKEMGSRTARADEQAVSISELLHNALSRTPKKAIKTYKSIGNKLTETEPSKRKFTKEIKAEKSRSKLSGFTLLRRTKKQKAALRQSRITPPASHQP